MKTYLVSYKNSGHGLTAYNIDCYDTVYENGRMVDIHNKDLSRTYYVAGETGAIFRLSQRALRALCEKYENDSVLHMKSIIKVAAA